MYTLEYKNKNPSGNNIRFSTEINPESENTPNNPYSFGRANLNDANIEVDQVLVAGVTKSFEERRVIDPCGVSGQVPVDRFVSELQLNGHVVGKEDDPEYSCSSRFFHSHYFAHVIPPTPAPVQPPIVPVLAFPAQGKGKGKIRERFLRAVE